MQKFKDKVLRFVATIPKGAVVSYGQVANICGKPAGAREVGWILRKLDLSRVRIPWWRVVNHRGVISIKGNWFADKELQAEHLRKEGIRVDKNLCLNIKKYRYAENR